MLHPGSLWMVSSSPPTSSISIWESASCSDLPTTKIWNNSETFVTHDPLGNPVDKKHPWNQTTIPHPQRRDFGGNYVGHVPAVV